MIRGNDQCDCIVEKFLGLQGSEATAAAATVALQQKTESPIDTGDEVENYGLEVTDTQVSGLATRTTDYMGPQGLDVFFLYAHWAGYNQYRRNSIRT